MTEIFTKLKLRTLKNMKTKMSCYGCKSSETLYFYISLQIKPLQFCEGVN